LRGRFVALDRLRALAVLLMVQGHTFTALLREGELPRGLSQVHALVHGLTAPAFLFGAGLAFGVATYPADPELDDARARSGKRFSRYARIFAIGYLLQLPGGSLIAAFQLRGQALAPVLRVGPLQLIALCLSVCQLLTFLRSRRSHALVCGAIGLLIAGLAPTVCSSTLSSSAPLILASWLDDRTGSLFPLFPWGCFAFVGVAAAYPLARASSRAGVWLVVGVALTLTTYALYLAGYRLSEPALFWKASPLNMAFRLGLVLCSLGALHHLPSARATAPSARSSTALLARQSLVAYVTHLLLLYGTPFTPSLVRYHGGELDLLQTSGVFMLVLTGTVLASYAWSRLGAPEKHAQRWVKLAVVVCSLAVLVR
jgi:uncharacterized membrane protein